MFITRLERNHYYYDAGDAISATNDSVMANCLIGNKWNGNYLLDVRYCLFSGRSIPLLLEIIFHHALSENTIYFRYFRLYLYWNI